MRPCSGGGQSYAVGPERKADPTLLTQHTTWDGWAGKRAKQVRNPPYWRYPSSL